MGKNLLSRIAVATIAGALISGMVGTASYAVPGRDGEIVQRKAPHAQQVQIEEVECDDFVKDMDTEEAAARNVPAARQAGASASHCCSPRSIAKTAAATLVGTASAYVGAFAGCIATILVGTGAEHIAGAENIASLLNGMGATHVIMCGTLAGGAATGYYGYSACKDALDARF